MKTREFQLQTARQGYYDITAQVRGAVRESGMQSGVCVIFCPHTTAAITINENADPDVQHDLVLGMDAAFPDRPAFAHAEGNADAHLKSSAVGASELVLVEDGKLLLGTWQGVYFCEFDGPRRRKYYIKVMEDK